MFSRRQFLATLFPALAGSPVALNAAEVTKHSSQFTRLQPSSSLNTEEMVACVAPIFTRHITKEAVISRYEIFPFRVSSTGSMRPAIGDGDVVLMERAPFEVLAVGDIVHAISGDNNLMHRLIGGDAKGYVIKGDNNRWRDPFLVTRETYAGWRVFATFYTRKS
ncbi:MAG TPA: S24/S26 family peptidase [Opitutaceae bacterium]